MRVMADALCLTLAAFDFFFFLFQKYFLESVMWECLGEYNQHFHNKVCPYCKLFVTFNQSDRLESSKFHFKIIGCSDGASGAAIMFQVGRLLFTGKSGMKYVPWRNPAGYLGAEFCRDRFSPSRTYSLPPATFHACDLLFIASVHALFPNGKFYGCCCELCASMCLLNRWKRQITYIKLLTSRLDRVSGW